MFYSSDNPRHFKFFIAILLSIMIVFCIILFKNRYKTVQLAKELSRIDHEIYLKECIYELKVKKFEEEASQREQQVLQMKSEILSKLKKNED